MHGHGFLTLALVGVVTAGQLSCTKDPNGEEKRLTLVSESEQVLTKRREGMAAALKREVRNPRVFTALREVPRHLFVDDSLQAYAYEDTPLPIGEEQTISAPSIVAIMTDLAEPEPTDRALDIGTGSGYQAAILAELVAQVYSIEIICSLADEARERLNSLGYDNVEVRCADGYRGWPEHAPFDLIIVAAAPEHIPQPLIDQLAPGGRLLLPVGDRLQELVLVEKRLDGSIKKRNVVPVRFVPMTGAAEEERQGG